MTRFLQLVVLASSACAVNTQPSVGSSAPHSADSSAPHSADSSAPHSVGSGAPHSAVSGAPHSADSSAPHSADSSAPTQADSGAPTQADSGAPAMIEVPDDRCPDFFPDDCFAQNHDIDGCPDPPEAQIRFVSDVATLSKEGDKTLQELQANLHKLKPGVILVVVGHAPKNSDEPLASKRAQTVRKALSKNNRTIHTTVSTDPQHPATVSISAQGCTGDT